MKFATQSPAIGSHSQGRPDHHATTTQAVRRVPTPFSCSNAFLFYIRNSEQPQAAAFQMAPPLALLAWESAVWTTFWNVQSIHFLLSGQSWGIAHETGTIVFVFNAVTMLVCSMKRAWLVVKPIHESNRGWRELGKLVFATVCGVGDTPGEGCASQKRKMRAKGLSNDNHISSPPWLQKNFVILGEIPGIPWPVSVITCILGFPAKTGHVTGSPVIRWSFYLGGNSHATCSTGEESTGGVWFPEVPDPDLQCQVPGKVVAPAGFPVSGQTAVAVSSSGQPRFGFVHCFLER